VLKPAIWIACLTPLSLLIVHAFRGELSANPVEDITNTTGIWTLRLIVTTIAITPLRWLTGINQLVNYRRVIGLFAFFYGSLHFLIYVIADRFAGLDFPDGIVAFSTVVNLAKSVSEDIYKRPFITIGFTTLMLMLPLALTSTAGMIRRLGGKRWNALHRLVYVAGCTGVIHYLWLVKADIRPPTLYAVIVGSLLAFRVWWTFKSRTTVKASGAMRRPA
jgi:sulfoxide reductase heme-binding subunit YedZ